MTRVIEAVNTNTNIKKLNIGVLTNPGLKAISELLVGNTSLDELEIQETSDTQKLWDDEGRTAFTNLLKESTTLKKISLNFTREGEDVDDRFKKEVRFYTGMKAKNQTKMDEYRKVLRTCDPNNMFDNLQELIENNEENAGEMPVRKFYNNTFGTLLNRAIFALTKKQAQNPDNAEFFTTEGMIKFVAFQLLDQPPDGEIEQNIGDDDSI